ncbi:MAG: cyanophycin synthetase, partial [Pseudomonadota bacterium]
LDLIGGFQAENALVAAGLAIACGEEVDGVLQTLPGLLGVRGRMEPVARRESGARVYFDYSHTPGGLESALAALRLHTPGRLLVVFGAGGDRDPGKRPMMGAAALAAECCDIYTDVDGVYTTDPRIVQKAQRLEKISYEEMLEMASLGAKVLQTRSVELAMNHTVPIRVLSSFVQHDKPNPG